MKNKQIKDDNQNANKETFLLKSNGTLAKKYLKLRDIGKGTYSKIYTVQNKSNFKVYLCKEILKSKISDLLKFKNDINILSKAEHPNLVRIYEIFEDERHFSLIMENCTGDELFFNILKKLLNGEPFSEKEAVPIFKQLMSAVSFCHSQGICHKDIKPENILFLNNKPDSPIKIIDFGLSKIFGEIRPLMKGNKMEKNVMSARVGTAYYMSPESIQGNYDNKCDIWSCGVILYIMLCGYPPFDGETEHDIFKAITRKKFSFPEEEWKIISDDAKDLIKHMICDADKRFNAENILNHQWVEKCAPNAKESLANYNSNSLKNYNNLYKLTKFIIEFISSRIGECNINHLRIIFEEMDTNKDGTLTLNEIKEGINKISEICNMNEEEKEEILKNFDTEKQVRIEYNEFIAACLEQKSYLREEYLLDVFMMLDLDGSGKISKQEIKIALNGDLENETLEKLIQEFDLDGDGEIDYREFLIGMANLNKKEEEVKEEKVPPKKHK
jgi:calcium-dependent protein kinase